MKIKIELPEKISRTKFIICRHYQYFTHGMSLTNIVKYGVVLIGAENLIGTGSSTLGIIGLALYAIFCYLLGLYWYHSGFIFAQQEVSNQFDMFEREMREMRDKLK